MNYTHHTHLPVWSIAVVAMVALVGGTPDITHAQSSVHSDMSVSSRSGNETSGTGQVKIRTVINGETVTDVDETVTNGTVNVSSYTDNTSSRVNINTSTSHLPRSEAPSNTEAELAQLYRLLELLLRLADTYQ